ncbi:ANKRD50, partial [Symbiodinium sp. CCMP2456]
MDEDLKSLAGRSERSEGAATTSTALCPNSSAGTVVDGQIFLKVRSCIACGRKNCDPNEVTVGPLSQSRFTVWHRGSSGDPQSKQDRICQLTYQHGSFGDDSLEEFVNNRMKKDPQLQSEFSGAREAMLKLLNEGKLRFKGKTLDVVMIRKKPEGVWDVNVTEKSGVRQTEEIDAGEHEIHEGQQGLKFASSRKRLQNAVNEKANESSVLSADSHEEQKDPALPRLPESSDEEEFRVSSLLDEVDSPPKKSQRPTPSSSSGANLASQSRGAKSKPDKQSPAVSKGNKTTDREPRDEAADAAEACGRGRPNKFKNQTPVEVLESSGMVEVKVYKKTMSEFYARTAEYLRKASALESKVKKWQNRPAETDELAGRQKDLASALHSGASVFQLSAKKSPNPDKMEQVLKTLRAEGLEVPMAWRDLLFQEKLSDCLRFKKLEEFAQTCQPGQGAFEGVADERADVMQASIHKCLGKTLCDLVPDPAVSQKKSKKGAAAATGAEVQVQTLLDLALRLVEAKALPEDMLRDLEILADALD